MKMKIKINYAIVMNKPLFNRFFLRNHCYQKVFVLNLAIPEKWDSRP